MKPLKCIFVICVADFYCSVVTYLGPESHPLGPGDQVNSYLLGKDLWGFWGWGLEDLGCCESWEVVSVTSCHFWFPQPRDKMSEHSTLDPSTLTEVPQKEAQHYFQERSWKTKACLEQEMGGEGSQRIQHPWPLQHKEWIQAYRLRGV